MNIKNDNQNRNDIDEIIKKYGSLEAFREVYIKALIQDRVYYDIPKAYLSRLDLISKFDISSPDFVSRDDIYFELLTDVVKEKFIIIDGKKVKYKMQELLTTFSNREKGIVEAYYGLNGVEPQNKSKISENFKVSLTSVYYIINRVIAHLGNTTRFNRIERDVYILDEKAKEEFIRKYFEKCDIFLDSNPREIDAQLKSDLMEILTFQKIIHSQRYTSFIEECFENNQLKDAIENDDVESMKFVYKARKHASELLKMIDYEIENAQGLSEESKNNLYKRLAQNSEFIRIFLESEISSEGLTNRKAVESFINKSKIMINTYLPEDDKRKKEYLDIIRKRAQKISEQNKKYLLGRLESDENYEISSSIEQAIFETPIRELFLSARSINALEKSLKYTVYDWITLSNKEKGRIRNLGKKSIDEVDRKVNEFIEKSRDDDSFIAKVENSNNRKIFKILQKIKNEMDNRYLTEDARAKLFDMVGEEKNDQIKRLKEYEMISKEIEKLNDVRSARGNISIESLGLSALAFNALKRAGVYTVIDWVDKPEAERWHIRNFGKKSYAEIEEKIANLNIDFLGKRKLEIIDMINSSNLDEEQKNELLSMVDSIKDAQSNDEKNRSEEGNNQEANSQTNEENSKDKIFEQIIISLKEKYDELDRILLSLRKSKITLKDEINKIKTENLESIEFIEMLKEVLEKYRGSYGNLADFKELEMKLQETEMKLEQDRQKEKEKKDELISIQNEELEVNSQIKEVKKQLDDMDQYL